MSHIELATRIGRGEEQPVRVIVDHGGRAVTPKMAEERYRVTWERCLVRDDGWTLAAPLSLIDVARKQWSDQWVAQVDRGGQPNPVLNGPCFPGCGACCCWLLVEVTAEDVVREPKLMEACRDSERKPPQINDAGEEWAGEFWNDHIVSMPESGRFGSKGGCPFLACDDKSCCIYATRPSDCVVMPVGGEKCRQARASMFEAQEKEEG